LTLDLPPSPLEGAGFGTKQLVLFSKEASLSLIKIILIGTKQLVLFSKEASLSLIKIILIGTKQLVLFMKKSWVFYTESTSPCHPCHLVVTGNCLITK